MEKQALYLDLNLTLRQLNFACLTTIYNFMETLLTLQF